MRLGISIPRNCIKIKPRARMYSAASSFISLLLLSLISLEKSDSAISAKTTRITSASLPSLLQLFLYRPRIAAIPRVSSGSSIMKKDEYMGAALLVHSECSYSALNRDSPNMTASAPVILIRYS